MGDVPGAKRAEGELNKRVCQSTAYSAESSNSSRAEFLRRLRQLPEP